MTTIPNWAIAVMWLNALVGIYYLTREVMKRFA